MRDEIIFSERHLVLDSLDELEKEIRPLAMRHHPSDVREIEDRSGASRWFGASYGDACKFIHAGWPEMTNMLRAKGKLLTSNVELSAAEAVNIETRRRKRRRGDHGDSVDMHRIWNGDLDRAWERPVKQWRMSQVQRYATIYINLTMNADVSAQDAQWRAAVALHLYEAMVRMGMQVEIWVGGVSRGSYARSGGGGWWDTPSPVPAQTYDSVPSVLRTAVCVKQFTQPLNDDRLSAMCSAAFFRIYGFMMIFSGKWPLGFGYGHAEDFKGKLPVNLQERRDRGERVFCIDQCFHEYSAKRIIGEVEKQLKEVGREHIQT